MPELSIGQVAQRAGVATSTLRYYEDIGLLAPSRRISGRRHYDENVFQRLALIQTGQRAGFTLAEVGVLLNNVLNSEARGDDWQALAHRKLDEMNAMQRNIERMKGLLQDMIACDESGLADCIVSTGQRHAAF
jgi:MerR family redox-sensitive transcriptional activator SoxR